MAGQGARAIKVHMPKAAADVTIYAGVRIERALDEVTEELNLYHGVRLGQVLEAVYEQGLRDGRRDVVDAFNKLSETPELRHRNPGRPRKRAARRPRKAS